MISWGLEERGGKWARHMAGKGELAGKEVKRKCWRDKSVHFMPYGPELPL